MKGHAVTDPPPGSRPRLGRRQLLKLAAAAPLAAGLHAIPLPAPRQQTHTSSPLQMWWWGTEEAPDIGRWIQDTATKFRAETGVAIEATPLSTGEVVDRFTSASAAGNPRDVAYFWNGIYHMENVWRG